MSSQAICSVAGLVAELAFLDVFEAVRQMELDFRFVDFFVAIMGMSESAIDNCTYQFSQVMLGFSAPCVTKVELSAS